MSIAATVTHLDWQGRNINLIDTPGEPSFQADVLSTLRVVEGAIVVVSGVLGVEVGTERLWRRCDELGLSRLLLVNLLDRERADFFAALEGLKTRLSDRCVAVELPIGSEHEFHGVVDLVHMVAYLHDGDGGVHDEPADIPDDLKAVADEYHDKLMDLVAETSDELMERYLEGDEITRDEMAAALKKLVTEGELFPVGCGAATRNIGTHGLLDLIVEGLPSPARARNVPEVGGASTLAYVFKTIADPFSGKINLLRVFAGTLTSDSNLVNNHTHAKERIGQLLTLQGKEHAPAESLPAGAIGAVAKLKETGTGDVLSDVDSPVDIEPLAFPAPVVSFAIEPKHKGDEEKVHTSLRRLQEEDPSLDVHRDPQTGETIVAGLSQMHVEVTLERMARRFGVEVTLHPPRVPYMETIRKSSRAQGRYKKQTGGRGQFGDCHITLEPLGSHEGYEFVDKIVGGVIPQGFRPAVDKGIQEAMQQGELARCPGRRREGDAGRRLLPHGRLVGDGVQDRRLDGVQEGLRRGRPGAARADHEARDLGARREHGRRHRRHDLTPRPGRGDGPSRRHDDDPRRGAARRGADLRPRSELDDRRPGRLPDEPPALRGGPGPRRPADHRRSVEGEGARKGVMRVGTVPARVQDGPALSHSRVPYAKESCTAPRPIRRGR